MVWLVLKGLKEIIYLPFVSTPRLLDQRYLSVQLISWPSKDKSTPSRLWLSFLDVARFTKVLVWIFFSYIYISKAFVICTELTEGDKIFVICFDPRVLDQQYLSIHQFHDYIKIKQGLLDENEGLTSEDLWLWDFFRFRALHEVSVWIFFSSCTLWLFFKDPQFNLVSRYIPKVFGLYWKDWRK